MAVSEDLATLTLFNHCKSMRDRLRSIRVYAKIRQELV